MEDIESPQEGIRLVIDWRHFLVALADTYFEFFLSKSTPDDIMQARTGDHFLQLCYFLSMESPFVVQGIIRRHYSYEL